MRVITGSARGRILKTLPGEALRPTAGRVKEGIFNIIQFDIAGRQVLDTFAGSGQFGIEALSRGAADCLFLDSDKAAVDLIEENLERTGFTRSGRVQQTDALLFLGHSAEQFDLVFLDPPYARGLLQKALLLLPERVTAGGIVVCEHPAEESLPASLAVFAAPRVYRYGKIAVSVFRKLS